MKNIGIRILAALVLVLLLALAAAAAGETVISDAAALTALMNDASAWSGSYKLGADIDLDGKVPSVHMRRPSPAVLTARDTP